MIAPSGRFDKEEVRAANPLADVMREAGVELRGTGPEHSARCPFHDDRHESLSVNTFKDLWKCHAGCGEGDVFEFVQLYRDLDFQAALMFLAERARIESVSPLRLYAARKQLPEHFLSKTFQLQEHSDWLVIPYLGRNGNLLSTRRRQDKPDGTRDFRWKNGSRVYLYGLNLLDKALHAFKEENERFVILVEGESDTHTISYATSFPVLGVPGANSFKQEWTTELKGVSRIYLIREPDEGGPTFISNTSTRLRAGGFAGDILDVALPAGVGDVSELWTQNPSKTPFGQALQELLRSATLVNVEETLVEPNERDCPLLFLGDGPLSPPDWLVDNLIPVGRIVLLVAPPAIGKTWLLCNLAVAVASGQQFLSKDVQQGNVLYVTAEDGWDQITRRLKAVLLNASIPLEAVKPAIAAIEAKGQSLTEGFTETLVSVIRRFGPDVIVFDPIFPLLQGDEVSGEDVGYFFIRVRRCQRAASAATGKAATVILAHHPSKSSGSEYASRGHSSFDGTADQILEISKQSSGHILRCRKLRVAAVPDTLRLPPTMDRGYIGKSGAPNFSPGAARSGQTSDAELEQAILDAVERDGHIGENRLGTKLRQQGFKAGSERLRETLKQLVDTGILDRHPTKGLSLRSTAARDTGNPCPSYDGNGCETYDDPVTS